MNVFDLFARLTLDTSEFERGVSDASRSFDRLGSSADSIRSDTAGAERAVDDFTHSVEETTSENNRAARALDDTEQALGDVRQEAGQAAPEIDRTSDGLEDMGESGDGAGSALSKLGETIVQSVVKGNLLTELTTKLIDGFGNLMSSIWEMDTSTEDLRAALGKLDTAFTASGYSTTAARKTFREFYKILGDTDTAVEASQLLARLTSSMEDQARWTNIAAGVYGTFGDSLPIEGLIEAANETAKVGQVTGVLADALNWVGISEDDFNGKLSQCADTAERTALITETLGTAYSEAASTMQSINATVMNSRDAEIELEEAQAAVGEQVGRLKTALNSLLAPSLQNVLGLFEKLTGKAADLAEEWAATADAARNPLPTDDIEASREQLEAWEQELENVKASLAGLGEDEYGGNAYWNLTYQQQQLNSKIANGTRQLQEMEAAEAAAAETAGTTADAVEMMTVSANGFSVTLAEGNLTLEEATERLETYTSAATEMFSKINTESTLSYQDVLDNMRANIDATNQFSENMKLIAGELPTEVANMFYEGGPSVYAGTVAMLAEAYNASDEGLSELTALWEEGGLAGINAFAESMGAEGVDPVGELAQTIESDTTVEAATAELVDRAAEAAAAEADTAGFDSAGMSAVESFIAGMRSKLPAVRTAAQAIADEAENGMNGGGGGSPRAGGLDYVPYDGYPAILHRGESVLTKAEAEEWRTGGGGNTAGITIVQNIQSVPQTPVELAAATAAYFETARWAI